MSEANGNGTNGAAAVAEPGSAEASIAAVAAIQAKQRGFNIPVKLAVKLAEARSHVDPVAKNGRNKDQNYSYVQAEDVVKEAGKSLAEAKVIVMPPEPVEIEFSDLRSSGGSSGKFVKVKFAVRVIDGETGEGYETERVGTATDYPGDKAIYKAETGMMKYFLSSLLQIPLGDGESDPETTQHGGGGARINDSSPASDKQKQLFKTLVGEKNLPKSAKKAIVDFVGGTEPKKGAISHAIDQLMNGDPLAFARECGWDGTVDEQPTDDQPAVADSDVPPADPEPTPAPEDAPADAATDAPQETPPAEAPQQQAPQADERPTVPQTEGQALVEFCREKGATRGELVTMLRSLGVDLPPDDQLTNEIVTYAVKNIAIADVARLKQMVAASAESKKAAQEAAEQDAAPQEQPEATEAPATEGNGTGEIDPKSPLGKTIERVSALGYKSEFGNLAWLLFDTDDTATLNETQLSNLTALLERASTVGIQPPSVAACIRSARESGQDVATRAERFEGWIAGREANAQATQEATEAHEAAEGPQQ